MAAPDLSVLLDAVYAAAAAPPGASESDRVTCVQAFFNAADALAPSVGGCTAPQLATLHKALDAFLNQPQTLSPPLLQPDAAAPPHPTPPTPPIRAVDWQAVPREQYRSALAKVIHTCASWAPSEGCEAGRKCLTLLITKGLLLLLDRGAPERSDAAATAGILFEKIDTAADNVVKVLSRRTPDRFGDGTTTTGLTEEEVLKEAGGLHDFLSLLLTLEQRWPGVSLADPKMLAKAVIGVSAMTPPALHPAWASARKWRERNRRFERCILSLYASTEWAVGAKHKFISALIDDTVARAPEDNPQAQAIVLHAKIIAVCSVLRSAALHQRKMADEATQIAGSVIEPSRDAMEVILGQIASAYPLFILDGLAALPVLYTWWGPLGAAGAGGAQAHPPLASVATISLCSFAAAAPSGACLRFVESALFHALSLPSPMPFLVSAEVWAFLRAFSPPRYVASALDTVLQLLVGVAQDPDDRRAVTKARLQHLARVLWPGRAAFAQAAPGEFGFIGSHVMRVLESPSGVVKLFDGAPRAMVCHLAVHERAVYQAAVAKAADLIDAKDHSALPAVGHLLRHVRIQPEWESAAGEKVCLPCHSHFRLGSAVQAACECPCIRLTKACPLFSLLRRLWKVGQDLLNTAHREGVAAIASPSSLSASFAILGTVLTILPVGRDSQVKLTSIADFVMRRVASPASPPCVVLAGQQLLARIAIHFPCCAAGIESNVWSSLALPGAAGVGPHAPLLRCTALANAHGYIASRRALGVAVMGLSPEALAEITKFSQGVCDVPPSEAFEAPVAELIEQLAGRMLAAEQQMEADVPMVDEPGCGMPGPSSSPTKRRRVSAGGAGVCADQQPPNSLTQLRDALVGAASADDLSEAASQNPRLAAEVRTLLSDIASKV